MFLRAIEVYLDCVTQTVTYLLKMTVVFLRLTSYTLFVILLTDDSALDPEPVTGYTRAHVQRKANEGGFELLGGESGVDGALPTYGIPIYPIVVGNNPTALAQANELAQGTGGEMFIAANATEVVEAIKSAVEDVVTASSNTICPTIGDWHGEYWVNSSLLGPPTLCRNDIDINFDWGTGSPDPVIPDDDFSMRWTRTLNFRDGNYRFHVLHDDGARIYVDNVLVGDFWDTCCGWDSTDVQLEAGDHVIRLEIFESGGDAYAQFWWEQRDISPFIGKWYVRGVGPIFYGASTDIPVPGDYNGDGIDDVAVFRESNSTGYIRGIGPALYGTVEDIPVVGDYNGDGKDDIAVFRESNNTWYIRGIGSFQYGQTNDVPVVGDYNGDGRDDIAVFRPSNGTWYIRGIGPFVYGTNNDIPVVGDYNGDGRDDIAVFREANNTWYIRGMGPALYGGIGDIPVVGDYNGDGKDDIAVFRPTNSTWYIRGIGSVQFGQSGDKPVVGDYNGDGKDDIAVFRPSSGTWYIRGIGSFSYGTNSHIAVPADYNGDGKDDIAVFRP
jgi:hypothetical protein